MKTVVKHLLHERGYTVKDLTERLWKKGVFVGYETVKGYCRAWDRRYGKPEVWEKIDECLKEMEVV